MGILFVETYDLRHPRNIMIYGSKKVIDIHNMMDESCKISYSFLTFSDDPSIVIYRRLFSSPFDKKAFILSNLGLTKHRKLKVWFEFFTLYCKINAQFNFHDNLEYLYELSNSKQCRKSVFNSNALHRTLPFFSNGNAVLILKSKEENKLQKITCAEYFNYVHMSQSIYFTFIFTFEKYFSKAHIVLANP